VRTILIIIGALLFSGAALAVDQNTTKPDPKLAEMLAAKDENGKPIISPEQQTYFNGLNDNLRELLNHAVQKETITRPEHLAALLALQLRPQKMELVLQNNCILCHSDSANAAASWVLPEDLSQFRASGAASWPGKASGAVARSATSTTAVPAARTAARSAPVSTLELKPSAGAGTVPDRMGQDGLPGVAVAGSEAATGFLIAGCPGLPVRPAAWPGPPTRLAERVPPGLIAPG
jgi:hypothetical protein